jgi:hypothetical protein
VKRPGASEERASCPPQRRTRCTPSGVPPHPTTKNCHTPCPRLRKLTADGHEAGIRLPNTVRIPAVAAGVPAVTPFYLAVEAFSAGWGGDTQRRGSGGRSSSLDSVSHRRMSSSETWRGLSPAGPREEGAPGCRDGRSARWRWGLSGRVAGVDDGDSPDRSAVGEPTRNTAPHLGQRAR